MSHSFLPYHYIQSDLERFSKSLSEKLGITVVPFISEINESTVQSVGYEMKAQNDFYFVTRSYLRNDRAEYAIKDRDGSWDIRHNGAMVKGDFPTLQEVIDYVKNIK